MAADPPSEHLPGYPPPISEAPWSTEFLMQAIEILPVMLRDGEIIFFKPIHADSYVVGWPAGTKSEEVARATLSRLELEPVVLHSTSWRQGAEEMIVTYIAVVPPAATLPDSFVEVAVTHTPLARGDATEPPPSIGVAQVLEHALRHLAWLIKDDPAIASALSSWSDVLAGYVPEPFRSLP